MADGAKVSRFDDPAATWAPLAPGRYCLTRCYCGACPQYRPISEQATNTPDRYTAVDRKAMASSTGRRVSLEDYRQARDARQAANRRRKS
jgi:hypothetical protein